MESAERLASTAAADPGATAGPRPALPPDLEHRTLDGAGARLHVALAGPPDGPLVVLLHGFPELWYAWRNQLGPLAAAGFRVAAPDQRGYAGSDKPSDLAAYTRDRLADDVAALIHGLGRERAAVIGHDWGAAVAWWLALQRPQIVARLAALNVPHPRVFAQALRTPAQLRRSWYMGFFQLPWLPEALLGARGARRLLQLMRRSTAPGSCSEEDLAVYREAYLAPGALRGMLAWYRAAVRRRARPGQDPVQPPTLLLWGRRDQALGEELARPSIDRCREGELVLVEDAGHFVALDAWPTVNRELLRFLSPLHEDAGCRPAPDHPRSHR